MSKRIIENKPAHISFDFVDPTFLAPGSVWWKLVRFRFNDEATAEGKTNIYSWQPHDPTVSLVARNQFGVESIVPHEKPESEPAANIPKYGGNIYTVWTISDDAVVSDRVQGVQLRSARGQPNAHVTEELWFERVTVPMPPEDVDLDAALLRAGEAAQVIQFNPDAALQKHIFAAGFVPNSPEFSVTVEGQEYIGQRAEHLQSGEVRIYAAQRGDWENVFYVVR